MTESTVEDLLAHRRWVQQTIASHGGRCEAMTRRRTRCRNEATAVIIQAHPRDEHVACQRHYPITRPGWW